MSQQNQPPRAHWTEGRIRVGTSAHGVSRSLQILSVILWVMALASFVLAGYVWWHILRP